MGVARTLLAWHLDTTPTLAGLHQLQAALGDAPLDAARQQLLEEALGGERRSGNYPAHTKW